MRQRSDLADRLDPARFVIADQQVQHGKEQDSRNPGPKSRADARPAEIRKSEVRGGHVPRGRPRDNVEADRAQARGNDEVLDEGCARQSARSREP